MQDKIQKYILQLVQNLPVNLHYSSDKQFFMSFTVYKSSAGSGKTFTLVKEYLSLILCDPQKFSRVLAITFTNKAATEMKERVISTLHNIIAAEQENSLIEIYKAKTKLSFEELKRQSSIVLALILHNYSEFSICTIDSFVHRIVRTFAYDLRIPAGFEVETDNKILIDKAIDLLIEQLGSNELLTRILLDFAENRITDESSWNIENSLKELSKILFQEDSLRYVEYLREMDMEILHAVAKKCTELNKTIENFVGTESGKILQLIRTENINPASFYQGNRGIYNYFKKIASGDFSVCDAPSKYVLDTIENGKWTASKVSEIERASIETVSGKIKTAFDSIQDFWSREKADYYARNLLRKNMFALSVLSEVEKLIHQISSEDKILHISEFGKRIAGIVAKESVPFIYERLGEKYQHFLIDEFQDTSVLQWQNLLPLIENSLSYESFNMVVGDAKQAIYRFRSGEVEQFVQLPLIYKKEQNPILDIREKTLQRNYHEEFLDTNYRSKKEIIDFNNEFFETIKAVFPENLKKNYEKHEQKLDVNNIGGGVQISFLQKEDYRNITLEKTEEFVVSLLQDGFRLKDIAVLCRKNSESDAIARFLSQKGYPIISSDSLLLKNSPVVIFMLAVFRWLHNPGDSIAASSMVYYLIQQDRLSQTNFHDFLARYKADKSYLNTCFQKADIVICRHELMSRNLYDMTENLIRQFSIDQSYDVYLQFFLDAVHDFMMKQNGSLSNFLLWWSEQESSLSVQTPENTDAIHITTIHKSKGLEFPAVIYPFADSTAGINHQDLRWVLWHDEKIPELEVALLPLQKDMEKTRYADVYSEENEKVFMDLINMLYVAFTRAADRLYILSQQPSEKEGVKSIPSLLFYYLNQKELWQSDQQTYVVSAPQVRIPKTENSATLNAELECLYSSDWMEKLKISQTKKIPFNTILAEEKKYKGNLIHFALSLIKTPDDIEPAVEKLEQKEWIDETEKMQMVELLNEFIHHPQIKPFFESGQTVRTEAEYMDNKGELVRMDRIIFKENETILIDFKTGKPEKPDVEQILNYRFILETLQYPSVRPILIYLSEEPEVVECA